MALSSLKLVVGEGQKKNKSVEEIQNDLLNANEVTAKCLGQKPKSSGKKVGKK